MIMKKYITKIYDVISVSLIHIIFYQCYNKKNSIFSEVKNFSLSIFLLLFCIEFNIENILLLYIFLISLSVR
jgi:hypothetical protein